MEAGQIGTRGLPVRSPAEWGRAPGIGHVPTRLQVERVNLAMVMPRIQSDVLISLNVLVSQVPGVFRKLID